ncbi:hypothetical protein JYU21_02920 [Alkaliphilus sp. AH-315-G20]|nr:hypothetical protein [Alkaliphilus sp. AH-315-G20]
MFVNLKDNRVLDIIDSRETKKVQEVLDTYPNLKYLSRDRGKEYQALSKDYEHIADRFHLIKNLSETITQEMKKILPHRIKFNIVSEVVKSPTANKNVLTNATIKKIELVKEVKSLYESGCSFREITRRIGLNRKTVSRYVKFDDIENAATYSASNRTSQTDEYAKIIKEIYMSVHSVTKLKKELEKRNIFIKYNTLTYYVRK